MENYEAENMLDDGSGNKTWLPGFSVATMMKAWNKHRTSAAYKTQLQNLTQAEALDLSGITSQIFKSQNEIYGPGFNTIQEAQSDVLKADPNFPNSDNDPAFLMSSGSDGWLPKYEVEGGDNGVLLQNYKKWLAAAQTALANGDKPRYAFSLQAFRLTAFWSASAGPSNSPRRSSRNMIGAKISIPRSGSAFLGLYISIGQ